MTQLQNLNETSLPIEKENASVKQSSSNEINTEQGSSSSGMQQYNLNSAENTLENASAPIEMNTYVQLEMENNNHACIPRVCRFCIAKLTLSSEHSVVLGVKLDASKRSIRTVDIPLKVDQNKRTDFNHSAELNLNYNIAYPHFLKKDTNFIYFYIQKRKKLKNRTILGFKTLAFTAIDLSSILQKPFTNDLPLFHFNSKIPLILNSTNFQNLNNPTNGQHIIGSLKILSLTSMPLDSVELENNFHLSRTYSQIGRHNGVNENEELLIDDYELDVVESSENLMKDDSENNKCGFISESDAENDATVKCGKKEEAEKQSNNPKNFTSKILSFIKKLRNENLMNNNDEIGENDDAEEYNEEYDYEFDSIEQVSDYDNSESDNSNADLYSIVSTPKPKLEPFFKNNSNPDLRNLNSNNFLLKIKACEAGDKVNDPEIPSSSVRMSLDSNLKKKGLKKNRSSSLNSSLQEAKSKSKAVEEADKKLSSITHTNEICSFFFIENYGLKSLVETNLENISKNSFFIDLTADMGNLLELISKMNLTQNSLELVIIGDDNFFNEFLKVYSKLLTVHAKILNILFIPFNSAEESIIANTLAKFSLIYCNYFTDHFWTSIDQKNLVDCSDQVNTRIQKYIETSRLNHYKKLTFNIGELVLNGEFEKPVPFIAEIKCESCKCDDIGIGKSSSEHRKPILTTSNSLPQFFNNMTSNSGLLLINANPSIDSTSFITNVEMHENDNELQLGYWRMERISTNASAKNENHNSDEYLSTCTKSESQQLVNTAPINLSGAGKSKIKKRSITGQFKNISIYRKPISCEGSSRSSNKNFDKFLSKNFQSSINCVAKNQNSNSMTNKISQQFLSLDYILKEKKAKMRLSGRKSSQKDNHKEINKISKLNLTQVDSTVFNAKVDGIDLTNIRSIEVSCNYENKFSQVNLVIP